MVDPIVSIGKEDLVTALFGMESQEMASNYMVRCEKFVEHVLVGIA